MPCILEIFQKKSVNKEWLFTDFKNGYDLGTLDFSRNHELLESIAGSQTDGCPLSG